MAVITREASIDDLRALGLFERGREIHRRYTKSVRMIWTGWVDYPVASFIAGALLDSPVSPNQISLLNLVLKSTGAIVVFTLGGEAAFGVAIFAMVTWQAAHIVDCVDGQLARARGTATAFGASLDVVIDIAGHILIVGSLAAVVARAFQLDATSAVALTVVVVGADLLLATSGVVTVSLRRGRVAKASGGVGLLYRLVYLTDHGLFVFIAGALVAFPAALGVYLGIASAMAIGCTIAQLLIYRRASSDPEGL